MLVKEHLRAFLGDVENSDGDVENQVSRMFQSTAKYQKTAVDGAASTATAGQTFHRCKDAQKVLSVYFLPSGTAAANGTNFATLQLLSGDGTAVPATVVASATTETVSMAIGVPFALTIVAAEAELDAADVLGLAITKDGTGVAVPVGELEVVLEEI